MALRYVLSFGRKFEYEKVTWTAFACLSAFYNNILIGVSTWQPKVKRCDHSMPLSIPFHSITTNHPAGQHRTVQQSRNFLRYDQGLHRVPIFMSSLTRC